MLNANQYFHYIIQTPAGPDRVFKPTSCGVTMVLYQYSYNFLDVAKPVRFRYQTDMLLGLAFFPLSLLMHSPFADTNIPVLARMRRQTSAGVVSEETAQVGHTHSPDTTYLQPFAVTRPPRPGHSQEDCCWADGDLPAGSMGRGGPAAVLVSYIRLWIPALLSRLAPASPAAAHLCLVQSEGGYRLPQGWTNKFWCSRMPQGSVACALDLFCCGLVEHCACPENSCHDHLLLLVVYLL